MSKKRQTTKRMTDKLNLGSEPWWMQDIRLAQRRIDAERERLRAAQSSDSSDRVEPSGLDLKSKIRRTGDEAD